MSRHRLKRYRVAFPAAGKTAVYDVEALSRPQALMMGYKKLREGGLIPVEKANAVEDYKATVVCFDEPEPAPKYDERGMPIKTAPGQRHPSPRVKGGGPPAPSLPKGRRGVIKGQT